MAVWIAVERQVDSGEEEGGGATRAVMIAWAKLSIEVERPERAAVAGWIALTRFEAGGEVAGAERLEPADVVC
jgi:hypothetical protein